MSMCIVSSQACSSHQLWKSSHLKNNELSKPQIYEVSKGVSKIILKFHMKLSFVQGNFGTLLVAFLFLHNGLLEISVELVSRHKSRRPCSINFPPASQGGALDVEILLSSQGSRIVSMKDSSITFLSQSMLKTFKSSESSKEVNPGSIEAFCYASLCCYRERKALYTELFSFFSPPWSIP
jgi:hypothetical protein